MKIVIAKPGYDATQETDPNKLVFSSDYDSLKYYQAGTVILPYVSGGVAETTVTHNLGYIPFFIVYVKNLITDTYSMCPYTFSDAGFYTYFQAYADSNKLYFRIETNGAPSGATFVYKIFRNDLGL